MSNVKNILLVGVGGQGTILASKVLSEGLMEAGFDVKMSEIHGMSQRGGNVSTQVRFGEVFSPIIGRVRRHRSFEKMEACGGIEYLKPGGQDGIKRCGIPSAPFDGLAAYPEALLRTVRKGSYIRIQPPSGETLGNPRDDMVVRSPEKHKPSGHRLGGSDQAKC